jgi:HEAT repeat protein
VRPSLNFLLVLIGTACALVPLATPEPHPPTRKVPARSLTQQLAADTARERDEAAALLLARGEAVLPDLEIAARSPQPAIRERAIALVDLIRHGRGAGSPARARRATALVREARRQPWLLTPGSELDGAIGELLPEAASELSRAAEADAERGFVREPLVRALARHATADSLQTLSTLLADERVAASSVLHAARDLGRRPDRSRPEVDLASAERRLEELLATRTAPLRRAAVALFAVVAGERGVAQLKRLVSDDPDAAVRVEAVRALGLLTPARHARLLRAVATGDGSARVREAALDALLLVPGAPVPAPAIEAADDPWPTVRAAAARLLRRDATPESLDTLRQLAHDPSARVRGAARRSLTALLGAAEGRK